MYQGETFYDYEDDYDDDYEDICVDYDDDIDIINLNECTDDNSCGRCSYCLDISDKDFM